MNASRLTRIFFARLIAVLLVLCTAGSAMTWAERDRHERRSDEPHKQRPLNFTSEQQRPIIPAPSFQHRSNRDWERDDSRRGDRSYRNGYDNAYPRFRDDRSDDSGYDRRGGQQRPVNDVIREVQNRYGGQVIGVQQGDSGMYRVRVLQRDGRVKNVLVPSD